MRGERRVRTQSWVEWTLPNPCNWADVDQVFNRIRIELGDLARWDDAVEVLATDDELIVRYEKPPDREVRPAQVLGEGPDATAPPTPTPLPATRDVPPPPSRVATPRKAETE